MREVTMRLQLALNVRNIDEAVDYYSKLFSAQPHKRREGYANFGIENPPLKLVLFENSAADGGKHSGPGANRDDVLPCDTEQSLVKRTPGAELGMVPDNRR